MSGVAAKHKGDAPSSLSVYIITCSTSRFYEKQHGREVNDPSGDLIDKVIRESGHKVAGRALLADDEAMIRREVANAIKAREVDAIIITGGTGLSPRDVTIEAIKDLFEKEIPGFGEILRRLSYDKIGPPAMMSRATAGVANGKAIFCLPGSPDGVELALRGLIVPELGHIIKIARE